jgi:MFS superfamily sulfate permease-like transporter
MGAIGYFLFTTGIDLIVSGFESSIYFAATSSHRATILDKIWIILSSKVLSTIFAVSFLASCTAALLQRHKLSSGNPFTIPALCFFLTFGFYISLLISGHSLDEARNFGWILISPNEEAKTSAGLWNMFDFYKYYFQPSKIDWSLIPRLFSTYLGMITFALINVPINVPAFSAATNQRPSLKRELSLHGISNLLGLLGGGLANYFIFSNSLLFYQSGGSRIREAGYLVALLTLFGLLFIYYDIFDFLPKFVPVFLVIYLTIELFWEAFIKSYAYIYDKRELLVILSIVLVSSTVGFSEGLFIGLGLALLDTVMKMALVPISDTSYPPLALPADAHLVSLSGYLFFGNVDQMLDVFQQLIPLLASNEHTTIILDFRGLVGWDLTFQLEFKGLTDQYRTLLSHPSVTWLIMGSRRYVDLIIRAGWQEVSSEDFASLRAASLESDEIYFKHIPASVDLDLALSQRRVLADPACN